MASEADEFGGKVALVTGTSGIGLASAIRLARGGASVLACGNDASANQRAMEAVGALDIAIVEADVSVAADVERAVGQAVSRFGGIDILVNAAAVHPFGDAVETTGEVFMRTLAINVGSVHLTAHFAVPHMRRRGGGAIVNLASVQGTASQRRVEAYATSKGAVLALTRSLALDFAKDGIRANSVSPGSVRTPMLEHAARMFDGPSADIEAVFRRFGSAHPLGRIGEVDEVAEIVAFLASSRASFVTGADFRVDGGLLAQIGVA